MKVTLLPLFSQRNPGPDACLLGCQNNKCKVKTCGYQDASPHSCPLSLHQVQTCAEVLYREGPVAKIIFNVAATGDGKSLAAYLAGLLDPKFRVMSLYPTIELAVDQETQLQGEPKRKKKGYFQHFGLAEKKRIDSLYGVELSRRLAVVGNEKKGERFRQLRLAIKHNHFILTNPDIFHLITHFFYWHPAYDLSLLLAPLVEFPHLYIVDEFHIFGEHQEAAILNSMLLIRHARQSKNSPCFLFTSATPKPGFIRKLKRAGFEVKQIEGHYSNTDDALQYRQIVQRVELEFVKLEVDSLTWLKTMIEIIRKTLHEEKERPGRGLIILNSVASVNKVVYELQKLLPDILIREVSGQVDSRERIETRESLETSKTPVLIVGTSAVDIGVDFDIHLLIFESSNSATFIQRLGRLGRHPGFSSYKAFALVPGWVRWIWSEIEKLKEDQEIARMEFCEEIIPRIFDSPQNFPEYGECWGTLQSQGMLFNLSKENASVVQPIRKKIVEDLRQVYKEQVGEKRIHWCELSKTNTGKAIQKELLRFRGGSALQAAIWDGSRFYIYDLLKFLPYAEVEVINRDTFLREAKQSPAQYTEVEFPDKYIQIYLKRVGFLAQRQSIELECEEIKLEQFYNLTLINRVTITGQSTTLNQQLSKQSLLTFLVPLGRSHRYNRPNVWSVSNVLHLSHTFGIYLLKDDDDDYYACAFNQDALLLEALKSKLRRNSRRSVTTEPFIY